MKRAVEGGEVEAKRARADSDVEEFFALLERIRHTEKHLGVAQKIRRPEAPPLMSKAAWHLSFEWEDFFSTNHADPAQDGNPKAGLRLANDNNKTTSNNGSKWWGVSMDQKKVNKEILDLNLPYHVC